MPAGDLSGEYRTGAVVEVGSAADADGGVWVFWKAHPHLSQAAAVPCRRVGGGTIR
jgi:hypothetical protein